VRLGHWPRKYVLLTALLGSAGAIAAGCNGNGDGEADKHDAPDGDVTGIRAGIKKVQVVPAEPTPGVTGPQTFQLFAWFLDGDNLVPGRSDPVEWSLDPTTAGKPDPSGQITIQAFPTNGSASTTAHVQKKGKTSISDAVTITRWASAAAAGSNGSVVRAAHPDGQVPSVALLEERDNVGACHWGEPRAFAGAAEVGTQEINPCSLSLFTGSKGMVFQENAGGTRWPAGQWKTSTAPRDVAPGPALSLKVTIFLAVTPSTVAASTSAGPSDPKTLATADVAWANALYELNRVGVTIDAQYVPLQPSPDLTALVGADPYDCVLPHELPTNSAATNYGYDPVHVSVYYVDRINYPPDLSYPRVRGIECHYWYSGDPNATPPGEGPVVFISYTHHSPVTLAHELGHALGLNDEEEMTALNVMNSLLPDGPQGADARSRLSVGQAFHMNVWNDSWINIRSPKPPVRACDDVHPCPPMALDVD
jgi:hypothetical protein